MVVFKRKSLRPNDVVHVFMYRIFVRIPSYVAQVSLPITYVLMEDTTALQTVDPSQLYNDAV